MIKLVQQPTADTCTSACLSMITGINVNDVINDFHKKWKDQESNPSEFLSHEYVKHVVNKNVFDHHLEWGFVYLLTVPSLNIDGGLHHIIADLSGDLEVIFDPNQGKESKRYYVGWSKKDLECNEINLKSWLVDIIFKPKNLPVFND